MLDPKFHDELIVLSRRDLATILVAESEDATLSLCLLQGDRVLNANRGFLALFGLAAADEALRMSDLVIDKERDQVRGTLDDALVRRDGVMYLRFRARAADGELFDAELHAICSIDKDGPAALAFLFDARGRQKRHEQLSFLAFLDPLTGLPNRSLYFDRFRETLSQASNSKSLFGVLVAGLDDFKAINQTLGSEVGDYVLTLAGERLSRCVRGSDTVARLADDRFAVLLPNLSRGEDAGRVADRMIAALREPFRVGRVEARLGLSVGIALYPFLATDIDSLFAAASEALSESKRTGKNRWVSADAAVERNPVTIEFLSWNEIMAVGIWAIDEQHQTLVDLTNRFVNDLKAGHNRDRLLLGLERVAHATRAHFLAEESLMREHAPSETDALAARHRVLLDELDGLRHGLERRSVALTVRYLQDWLKRHIEELDKPMARALRAAGVQ